MGEIDKLVDKQEAIDFLLDSILSNPEKFNALPNKLKDTLLPYKEKLEKGESLTKEDYQQLKELI